MKTLACLALALLGVACSAPPNKMFEVKAINTREEPVNCVVFVDNRPFPNADEPALTPARLDLDFEQSSSYKVTVKPCEVDATGRPVPDSWNIGDVRYLPSERYVDKRDPKIQLFILDRN
ncbi:MAG: hypothetical protein RL885_09670 [Planctomycetota bacterium]